MCTRTGLLQPIPSMATRMRSRSRAREVCIDTTRTRVAIVTYGQRRPHARLVQNKEWQIDAASIGKSTEEFETHVRMNGYHHATQRAVLTSPGVEDVLKKGFEMLTQLPPGEVLYVSCAHGVHRSVCVGVILTDWCMRLLTNVRQFDMGLQPTQRAAEDVVRAAEKYAARPMDPEKMLRADEDIVDWAGYATCVAQHINL